MLTDCYQELKALRTKYGTSNFDHAIKKLNRERLQAGDEREKRKSFTWPQTKKQAEQQRWLCGICGDPMRPVRGTVAMDHKNPNRIDFNASDNLQAVHAECNRAKSSKSILHQSKETGKPFTELV